jgi:hypothetical protein
MEGRMPTKVTVEIPDDLARQARDVAARTQRSFEDVVGEWIRMAGGEPVLELLSDQEVLAVCDATWDTGLQEELGDLLEQQREGELNPEQRSRLNDLMANYRVDLLRKSQAIKVAVGRGLRPRLG